MLNILRWVLGVVTFDIKGTFAERFLNLCGQKGLKLWSLFGTQGNLTGKTYPGHYKKMRPLAKRTGVRIRVQHKSGLPFALHHFRGRIGFFTGAALFCVCLYFASTLVWQIDVVGNEITPTQQIVSSLEELGLKNGVNVKNMNLKATGEQLMLKCENLAGVAISYKGSVVMVKVSERTVNKSDGAPGTQNLVASKAGVVVSITPTKGHAVVKAGDAVSQGQLLITGIFDNYYGKTIVKEAQGEVLAYTEEEYTFFVENQTSIMVPLGKERTKLTLDVFGMKLPLFLPPKTPTKVHTQYSQLQIGNTKFPLGVYVQTMQKISFENHVRTDGEIDAQIQSTVQEYITHHKKQDANWQLLSREQAGEKTQVSVLICAKENIATPLNLTLQ